VTEAVLPAQELIVAAQSLIAHVEGTSVHLAEMAASRHLYGPGWQAITDLGQLIPAPAYAAALRLQRELTAAADDWLDPADLLILPTCGDPVPDLSSTGNATLQALFTFLGMPAITLPAGRARDGLPRGIQVVARRGADLRLLRAAAWMQEELGYPVSFPLAATDEEP
jgi:Asp-tRNA(Asn)/Glu-tRNA(Gln) amidotransferase A subunit family amidase